MRVSTVFVIALLALAQSAQAVITFTQLDDDIFVISHRVKFIGSRGKATKLVYEKAASLCVAAGYSYFKILDQESNASQQYESANASVRVQFFLDDDEGRIGCEKNASSEYVEQAGEKLAKQGYKPPEPPSPDEEEAVAEGEAGNKSCTVEQISAMVRAGFSDEQVKAACPD
jgi:hypothetical protein